MRQTAKVILFIALISAILEGGFNLKRNFLSPDEAFKVSAKIVDNSKIETTIKLGDKIHIYAKDLKFKVIKPKEFELNVAKPKGVMYEGDEVYYDTLKVDIPLSSIKAKGIDGNFTLLVHLSGCSDAGICYQPQEYKFNFAMPKGIEALANTTKTNETKTPIKKEGFFSKISKLSSSSNSGSIAKALASEGVIFIILLFFIAGLLLSLTPCILPMIPILSSIIVKQANKDGEVNRSTSFIISLVYVLAMSITYALIGVIAGLLGFDIQAHLNNPWVIIPISALFIALALSLFGYFELALPTSWQNRLNSISGKAQGKGLIGTAIMGALSALIVGTCTAPVISGAIIFISQTGDALLGGVSLFVMGLGAGAPLLLVGAGANALVPKPGGWMVRVSQIFGVIMLAMAIYVLRGMLSPFWLLTLFGALLIGSSLYMSPFDNSKKGASKLIGLLAFILLIYGSILIVGAVGGAKSLFNPLEPFTKGAISKVDSNSILIPIKKRKGYSLERLKAEIKEATKEGKPVIVDIGKENCASCSELEHITFSNDEVKEYLKRFKFIQIDITDFTPKEQEILKYYGIFGAPNILFFDSNGKPLKDKFLVGFIKPKDFIEHIKGIK